MSKKPTYAELVQKVDELKADKIVSDAALRQFNSYMSALHATALGILGELDLTILLQNIIREASFLIGTDDGYIFLYDQKTDELVIKYGIGRFEDNIGFRLKPGEGLAGKVWLSGKPLKTDEYDKWNGRHPYPSWNGMGFDLGIPLKSGDKLIGVIGLCSYDKEKKVGHNEELILARFAELASIALNNADLHSSLQKELDQKIHSEKALRMSQDTLHTILNSIDSTIYVSDMKTYEVIFMNKHMQDSFGENLEGQICHKVFRGEKLPCSHCTNAKLVDKEGRPTDLIVWEGSNPITKRWYINYDRAIEWIDGRVVKLQIASDITNLKSIEKEQTKIKYQLYQAQKMEAIGTLAGGIAHDFNNILSAIIGYTELSLSQVEKETGLYNNLREVIQAGGRAKDLVKQILTFSRQADQELKPVQVNLIIKEVLKFLRATMPTTIEIRQDIKSNSLVMADPSQIHQVIMNLCTNAGHAMVEKGGVLEVKLTDVNLEPEAEADHSELKPGPYLELTISDTGHGIPPHFVDRIYDPFFTTKEVSKGTGMGLAVVHGIVRSCEGSITVSSKPGKSTIFKVYIPAVKNLSDSQAGVEDPVPLGTERILLVDDELALVNLGQRTLESLGYKVTARTSSLEALELFRAKPDRFDLVITDMTMPNMAGDDLAQELMNISPDTPVILCTGYSERINREQAIAMGIRAFVSKPVLRKEIANIIRKVLDDK